jgi:slime mold repeat-containing protein/coenzyme PQQ synthesis protein D (PqqD)
MLSERVDDELVLYDSVRNTAHCLSGEAAEVWRLCDGERSVEEIASEIGQSADRVSAVLGRLGDSGLLELGSGQGALSRRDVAKRFAQLGAAALSAPLVYSVDVPAAAAASSSGRCTNDGDCIASNGCLVGTCNTFTGNCTYTPKNCNDNNRCTIDTCDSTTGNCLNTPVVCTNTNPCQNATCDAEIGCVYTEKVDGTPCGQESTCQAGVCTATT